MTLGIGAGVLTYVGPPSVARSPLALKTPVAPRAAGAVVHEPTPLAVNVAPPPAGPVATERSRPGAVAEAQSTLLEPYSEDPALNLPRIAADGRMPMKAYAADFDRSSRRPRIGLLLAGIGLNEADSDAAIRALPAPVSLAMSPYVAPHGPGLMKLLAAARSTGHEYLIELPLEPAGFPLNDPGPSTLLTSASGSENRRNLLWALSRIDGYVGATGLIGTMRGERLASMSDQMEAVLSELSGRGLLYIDPRQGVGAVSKTWGRHVDLVVDDPVDQGTADRAMIDAKLAALEQQARDAGTALGLVMLPTPVAVARIVSWSNGLAERGLTLAPVSALAMPPAEVPVKMTVREE